MYIYSTFDYPDSNYTTAYGINDSGQVVGSEVSLFYDGYLYTNGTYTPLHVIPYVGTHYSEAHGINKQGDVVGIRGTFSGADGYLYSSGVYTLIDDPLGAATEAFG